MSLRQKTLLLTALTLAGLLLILAAVSGSILFPGAAQIEQRDLQPAVYQNTTTTMVFLLPLGLVFGALTLIWMARLILRLLEELRAANERLTEYDRLKSQFVATVSHELRAPLHAILGFSELLGDEASGPLNDEQRDYVRHIETGGRHLLALIGDILDLSKLQAKRLELEQHATRFSDILATAQTFVWPATQHKRQTIVNDLPPDLPNLYVDPLRIKQVLINLLNNACKFAPPEGRITVSAAVEPGGWLRVSVSDTGPGIPSDKQGEVFEEFTQLDWRQPGAERGTGLGLSIARRLIELHGGRIWIESAGQPGGGTTFHFTLPAADTAAAPRSTQT